jgi:aryl-alcohol dehydrogenase-like predicted oxidoreductase
VQDLSRIGLGLYPFGGGYGPVELDDVARTLDAALEHGWTFLDTAEVYGDSEVVTGQLLRGRREEHALATKAFPCEPYTADALRAAAEGSLRRLGTDYLDLYQLHGPEDWLVDQATPVEEVAAGLEQLRTSGLVRHVGVCNFTAARLEEINSRTEIFSIQNLYGMLDRTSSSDQFQFGVEEEILAYTASAGVRFIAYSPLGRGLLAEGKDPGRVFDPRDERHYLPRFQPDVYPAYVALANTLAEWARARGHTLPELAVAWVLRLDAVDSVLLGAKTVEQVEAIAGARDWRLDAGEIAELEQLLDTLPAHAREAQASVFEHIPPERLEDLRRRRYDAASEAPIRYR